MMLRTTSLFAALVVLVLASTGFISQTEAALISYQITGTVDGSVIAGINAGEPYYGKFTYDTDMPLYEVYEIISQIDGAVVIRTALYYKAPPKQPLGMSVTFGTRRIAPGDSAGLSLYLTDAITGSNDRFSLSAGWLTDPAFSHLNMQLVLAAYGLDKFSSIQIPASLDLAVLPRAKIYFGTGEPNGTELQLTIETLDRIYFRTSFTLGQSV